MLPKLLPSFFQSLTSPSTISPFIFIHQASTWANSASENVRMCCCTNTHQRTSRRKAVLVQTVVPLPVHSTSNDDECPSFFIRDEYPLILFCVQLVSFCFAARSFRFLIQVCYVVCFLSVSLGRQNRTACIENNKRTNKLVVWLNGVCVSSAFFFTVFVSLFDQCLVVFNVATSELITGIWFNYVFEQFFAPNVRAASSIFLNL